MTRLPRLVLYSLPLLFLAAFYLYPLLSILRVSFAPTGQLDLLTIGDTLRQPILWRVFWFTTWQAVASTVLTLLLGFPLAWLFARYHFPGKPLLRALLTIPFVMPTVVVATGFSTLFGDNGLINQGLQTLFRLESPPLHLLGTVWIILIAHAFYNVSVVVRMVGGFWSNLDPRLEEAAAILGANPRRVFYEVTWPLLQPSVIAAGLLVFLFCFTSFGVVLILGGLRFATIEVEIYRQTSSMLNLPVAATLSLLQMGFTFVVMSVYTHIQSRSSLSLDLRPQTTTARHAKTMGERWSLGLGLALFLLILLAPLLALAIRSVTLGDDLFTLQFYRELGINRRQSAFFVAPWVAIVNSLWIAASSMLLSLLLGVISTYLLAQRRSWVSALLDPFFLLPLGTSAVTLGFGYIISMGALRTSPVLTPIAHTLIATPFVVRTLLPALRRIDPRLREAAAVLGATPRQVWREIDLPLLWRSLLVAAVFAFTISLGEFGATLLIARPDLPTMPVVIYQAMSRPGLLNYGQALAMSTILMVVCTLALVLIERFRIGEGEEF